MINIEGENFLPGDVKIKISITKEGLAEDEQEPASEMIFKGFY